MVALVRNFLRLLHTAGNQQTTDALLDFAKVGGEQQNERWPLIEF